MAEGVSSLVEDLVKVLPPLMQVAEEIGAACSCRGSFASGPTIRRRPPRPTSQPAAVPSATTVEVPVQASDER
jgi:hypothetical protein